MRRKAAVCDDNTIHLSNLTELLEQSGMISEITCYSDYNAVKNDITSGHAFDLVFMDFDWEQQEDGIDLAALLYKHCPSAQIIFVTSYPLEYVQQVFLQKINIAGFLIKPVDGKKLSALLKVLNRRRDFFEITSKGQVMRFFTDEVTYIESEDHYINVHFLNKSFEKIYMKISAAAEMLPPCFFRCHKGYLVNLNMIEELRVKEVILKDGEKVFVSRTRFKGLQEAYARHIMHYS